MTAFIGRDHELELLTQALEGARQGAGSCWMLAGEAGIGKSRLIEEIKRRALSEDFHIRQGNCFQQDASIPYGPWIDALRMSFALLTPADIRETLGPLASEINKLLPELRLLLPDIDPNPTLEAPAEKYRLFESLSRLLLSRDIPGPSLIVLEDLHWSDSVSLELLHLLSRRIPHLPVLLIGTYRSDDSSTQLGRLLVELNRERLVQELDLKPLNRHEVEELTRGILHQEQRIPTGLVDSLLGLTDGNPFFIEEVLQALAGESRSEEPPRQTSLDELPIPRSIQRMVQERAELLPQASFQVLIHAAVIGERFDFGLLQETTGRSEHGLLETLKELVAAGLVVSESTNQFAFRHSLTRQAVYSMLMLRERKVMHQTIGDTLERLAASPRDAAAAQLAYHFYQAGIWDKAMEYSQRAGEQALSLYGAHEAFTHFTRALDAAQHIASVPGAVKVSLYRGRAQARETWDDFDGARSDYEAALQVAQRGTIGLDEWQTLIDLGLLLQSRDLERAGEMFQRALALAGRLGDPSLLAQSLNRVGNWHANCGHGDSALPLHREALELFRKLDNRRGMARTMELLGITNYQLCDVIHGAAYLEQAVPIFRQLDDRQALVSTLAHLAWRPWLFTEILGDTHLPDLARLSDEALQIARGLNWHQGEALALMQGAICLKQAGNYGQALEWLSRMQRMIEESRNRDLSARTHAIFGEISNELLDFAEAQRHFETSLAVARELGSGLLVISAKTRLAQAAILQKDLVRARALLTELLATQYPNGHELAPARGAWSICVELELAQNDPGRALEIVELLIASTVNVEQSGPHAVPRLSQLRGEALAALGRLEEAETELQAALSIATKQGQRPIMWRLHADLGRVYRTLGRRENAAQEFASARALIQELAREVPQEALRDNFVQRALALLPRTHAPTERQAAKQEFGGLTAREREIATLVGQAKSNREIAHELVISEKTTERHIANILSKLGFNSRTQIAVWAAEKGLRK